MIYIPRVNTVQGLTTEHIQKWGWQVNERGWVNWPDYQTRIYKNTDEIQWMNKVHERITDMILSQTFHRRTLCLYHPKQIERQENRTNFTKQYDRNYRTRICGTGLPKIQNYYDVLTYDLDKSKCNSTYEDLVFKSDTIFLCLPTPMNEDSCHTDILEKELVSIDFC